MDRPLDVYKKGRLGGGAPTAFSLALIPFPPRRPASRQVYIPPFGPFPMTRAYLSEFIGTFGLVFIGGGAVLANGLTNGAVGLVGIALAHGLVLMALIYALSSFCGAHFNPAVTLAMLAHKRISPSEAGGYIVSQLLGATAAAALLLSIFPQATAAQLYGFPLAPDPLPAMLLEAVLTFFLVGVIYGLAVNPRAVPGLFGLGIGATVAFDILAGGPFTGAAMNPARAFGPALVSGLWGPQAIYWVGPIGGALIASFVWEHLLSGPKPAAPAKKRSR